MSGSDVPPDEMDRDPNTTDDALERMLSGQAPMTDEWRELAGFVDDLHEAVPARDLASEDMHVAAMVETSHLIADDGDPVRDRGCVQASRRIDHAANRTWGVNRPLRDADDLR